VANICNFQNDFRYIFEPLNPSEIEHAMDEFSWYLTDDDQAPFLHSILEGRISNQWVNSRNKRLFARRRLIKEIRSNTMLKWIQKHCPSIKVVVIIRNPLAVAASRKRLEQRNDNSNWVWVPTLKELLAEPRLKSSISAEQFELLSKQIGKGVVMETIADWCINNLLAFDLSKQKKWHLVYYEELLTNGDEVVIDLMKFLQISIKRNIQTALIKRSETTRSSPSESSAWSDVLSSGEIEQANKLLNTLGVDKLYTKDWNPVLSSSLYKPQQGEVLSV